MVEVKEFYSQAYGPRTQHNAKAAQLTCAFACDMYTAGEMLTKKCAGLKYLGFEITRENINSSDYLAEWCGKIRRYVNNYKVKTINVAGNGIYTLVKYGVHQEEVNNLLFTILSDLKDNTKLQSVVSGGQTGVDIAAAVACYKLGIDCIITLPKGFIQRNKEGVDMVHTKEQIEQSIYTMSEHLQLLGNADVAKVTKCRL